MEREAFVFYRSYYEAAMELPEKERLKLYDAIIEYALYGVEPDIKGVVKAVFVSIKPGIDSRKKRSASASAAANARWMRTQCESDANAYESHDKEDMRSVCEDDADACERIPNALQDGDAIDMPHKTLNIKHKALKERDTNVSPKKRFVKPTVEEVRAYCIERHNSVDPEAFVDFYESKGWKIGDQPMKDWKACVRTWERSESRRTYSKPDDRKGQSRGTDYDSMIAQSLKPETEAEREERKRKVISQNVQQLLGMEDGSDE